MTIGCALPLAGLAAIFLFQIPVGAVALVGLFLLCPALHLWLLREHVGHTTIIRRIHGPAAINLCAGSEHQKVAQALAALEFDMRMQQAF